MKHDRNVKRVYILDTTLRDGEQSIESGPINGSESKVLIAHALADAKVDRIEAGYPNSSPGDFDTVQRIAREIRGSMIFGLARVPLNGSGYADIERAFEAVSNAQYRGIHVFSIMFDPYSLKQYGVNWKQVVEGSVMGVDRAKKLLGGRGQVEFSFQNATNTNLDWIIEGYRRVVETGADVVNVPDTIGYSHPEEITAVISALRKEIPAHVMISIHCHDDLGNAVANSSVAVKAGADIVECTVNGIGERAGNASLEEVVMNIVTRADMFGNRRVGVVTKQLNYLSQLVSLHFNMPVQPNKPIVGENAFRHSSGIHQDGMVKGSIYQIMTPESVGWTGEGYNLTPRSGWAGVKVRLERLGYEVQDGLKADIMPSYKILADEKKQIDDYDLVCFFDSTKKSPEKYSLVDFEISKAKGDFKAKGDLYHASVTLKTDGLEISSDKVTGNGNMHGGAIDSLFTAISSITGKTDLNLVRYTPINIGSGSNATAEVTVVLSRSPEFDGKLKPLDGMYVGRARHVDTLRASVMAYVDALNKAGI